VGGTPEPPVEPPPEEDGGQDDGGEQPQQQHEILIQPEQLAGLWANYAQVSYTQHEFTIDFVRLDPLLPRGIVVARLSGSPTFIMQLIDTLTGVWQDWAKKAMPPEVYESDGTEADDPTADD
jgi:hypothetical protein